MIRPYPSSSSSVAVPRILWQQWQTKRACSWSVWPASNPPGGAFFFSSTSTTPNHNDDHRVEPSDRHDQQKPKNGGYQLCFVRHGQSTWNRDNRFIGWTDTPLTDDGVVEARVAGQMLYQAGLRQFDQVHTSWLRRSIRTANLVLMELGQEYLPMHKDWRLNERHYGALVGLDKKQVVRQYGADQVKQWRRSFDQAPPPMPLDHPYHPARDARYQQMLDRLPQSESLKDTLARSKRYWEEVLVPAVRDQQQSVLVIGHENNLRSLLMHLEDLTPEQVLHLNLPRAVPLVYRLDLETMKPLEEDQHQKDAAAAPEASRDVATEFLRGTWLGGDDAVSQILHRDHVQVYDTQVEENLETTSVSTEQTQRQKWAAWMKSVTVKKPTPQQAETGATTPNDQNDSSQQGKTVENDDEDEVLLQQGYAASTRVAAPVPGGEIDYHFTELSQSPPPRKELNGLHSSPRPQTATTSASA